METKMECLVIIVNSGFTDVVMDAARKEGARGGTIFHAKGTGSTENEKFFGITITPDKEIVLILCQDTISEKILLAVNQNVGLSTPGAGIGFALPVSDVIGIQFKPIEQNKTIETVSEEIQAGEQTETEPTETEEK